MSHISFVTYKFTLPESGESDKAKASNWELDDLAAANSFHIYKHETGKDIVVDSNTEPVWISGVNADPTQSKVTILHPLKVEANVEDWGDYNVPNS